VLTGAASWRTRAAATASTSAAWAPRDVTAVINALTGNVSSFADSPASSAAARMLGTLLGGLQKAHLVSSGTINALEQHAEFQLTNSLNSRGVLGDFDPNAMVPVRWLIDKRLRVRWESKEGLVKLHFSGLKIGPVPNSYDVYRKSGLDKFVCKGLDRRPCHFRKAAILEQLWETNRDLFPPNLQQLFGFKQHRLISSMVQRMQKAFGWVMLATISAPPMNIDTLEFFTRKGGNVEALTEPSLDWDTDKRAAKLAQRHDFKELSREVCLPLMGEHPLGGLVRTVSALVLPLGANLVIANTASAPRYRRRGVPGADSNVLAQLFASVSVGVLPSGGPGFVTWKRWTRSPFGQNPAFVSPPTAFLVGGLLAEPSRPAAADFAVSSLRGQQALAASSLCGQQAFAASLSPAVEQLLWPAGCGSSPATALDLLDFYFL
ncbi:unnamed protein product, partial [Polarella glacialis]